MLTLTLVPDWPLYFFIFTETTPLLDVSLDSKVILTVNRFRDLIDALPAGLITIGSFCHPHLSGSPKLPFVLPVREVLKSNFILY